MSTQQAKRRRLDNPAVHKPFKSPLKHVLTSPNIYQPTSSSTPPSSTATTTVTHDATLHHLPTSTSTSPPTHPPILVRTLRENIDLLTQATALLRSNRDDELARLILVWRRLSRDAAEEVFAGVRDKVNRMGGVGAWRERERAKGEWRRRWNEDVPEGRGEGDGEDLEDEDEDDEKEGAGEVREAKARAREAARERMRELTEQGEGEVSEYDAREEGAPKKDPLMEGGCDDDTFTMDMMLRQLNVDLDIIGYDVDEQRWKE